MDLSSKDFDVIRSYIYKVSGISVTNDKSYLIRQRLEPVARAFGCKDFTELGEKLAHDDSVLLRNEIILSIATNETSFFRDVHPFNAFENHILNQLARLIEHRKTAFPNCGAAMKANILCAGASTGQEPYSIAILIDEYVKARPDSGVRREDFNILATDISKKALGAAVAGKYSNGEISRGLSDRRKTTYFEKCGDRWRIIDLIRTMVKFHQLNIVEPYSIFGLKFDVIFCRNILIYFDDHTKRKVFETLYRLLADDGYLFLGAMESTYMLTDKFESMRIGNSLVYRKCLNF